MDTARKSNFLTVDSSAWRARRNPGHLGKRALPYPGKRGTAYSDPRARSGGAGGCTGTSVSQIEQAFHDFTTRKDIAILLITQNVGVAGAAQSTLSGLTCGSRG